MANPKPIAQIPQFLLPKLTWTSTPVKGAVSRLPSLAFPSPQRHSISSAHHPSLSLERRIAVPSATWRSHFPITVSSGVSPPKRSRQSLQAQQADASPIRHNGIYVAAFRPARRAFSAAAVGRKAHHFDTLKFVQRLKGESFSEEQAVAMMRVLNDVIEESIQNLTRTMVLKEGEHVEALKQCVKDCC